MEEMFLPLLVVLTSVGACVVGSLVFGLSLRGLAPAMRQTLELVGLTVIFLVANLSLGLAVVLGARALSMPFISVYILNDASLIVLSAVQATIVAWWWRSVSGSRGRRAR
jgi:hypothetical protein